MKLQIRKTLRRKGIRKPSISTKKQPAVQIQTPEQVLAPEMGMHPEVKVTPHPNWVPKQR